MGLFPTSRINKESKVATVSSIFNGEQSSYAPMIICLLLAVLSFFLPEIDSFSIPQFTTFLDKYQNLLFLFSLVFQTAQCFFAIKIIIKPAKGPILFQNIYRTAKGFFFFKIFIKPLKISFLSKFSSNC